MPKRIMFAVVSAVLVVAGAVTATQRKTGYVAQGIGSGPIRQGAPVMWKYEVPYACGWAVISSPPEFVAPPSGQPRFKYTTVIVDAHSEAEAKQIVEKSKGIGIGLNCNDAK